MPHPEIPAQAESVSDTAFAVLADRGVPAELIDRVLTLTRMYGPELLTAVLGAVGIHMINRGSSRYGDVRENMNAEEKNAVVRDASGKVLAGTAALATVAFTAGNPLFAIPEVAACLTSLRPYLDSRFPKLATISENIRADIGLAGIAAVTGIATASAYAKNWWDALPPLGLSAISAAFAIGGEKAREKLYRILTISGGTAMVAGSAHAMSEALQQHNGVGTVMAGVFLALNAAFTKNEIREVLRMGKGR